MDWSKLPDELLILITRRLHSIEDYVRFGGVCKSWHMITLERDSYSCFELPWVMHTEKATCSLREFQSIFNDKVYKFPLPEICGRRCWGSAHGWLVTVGTNLDMHILNPLSRVQILLPPLYKCPNLKKLVCHPRQFRDHFVHKAVLSSRPSDPNCVVAAIYSGHCKMAFTRLNDEVWTPLESSPVWLEDIIYVDGNFYAVNSSRDVLIFDSTGSFMKRIAFISCKHGEDYEAMYLVELEGEILLVIRHFYDTRITDIPKLQTLSFGLFKLDICSGKWKSVFNLGNWSIFLGCNYSFSILVSNDSKCRKNCIYFLEDYYGLFHTPTCYDIGIYDLDNGWVKPFFIDDVSPFVFSVPLWIRPDLW